MGKIARWVGQGVKDFFGEDFGEDPLDKSLRVMKKNLVAEQQETNDMTAAASRARHELETIVAAYSEVKQRAEVDPIELEQLADQVRVATRHYQMLREDMELASSAYKLHRDEYSRCERDLPRLKRQRQLARQETVSKTPSRAFDEEARRIREMDASARVERRLRHPAGIESYEDKRGVRELLERSRAIRERKLGDPKIPRPETEDPLELAQKLLAETALKTEDPGKTR